MQTQLSTPTAPATEAVTVYGINFGRPDVPKMLSGKRVPRTVRSPFGTRYHLAGACNTTLARDYMRIQANNGHRRILQREFHGWWLTYVA